MRSFNGKEEQIFGFKREVTAQRRFQHAFSEIQYIVLVTLNLKTFPTDISFSFV